MQYAEGCENPNEDYRDIQDPAEQALQGAALKKRITILLATLRITRARSQNPTTITAAKAMFGRSMMNASNQEKSLFWTRSSAFLASIMVLLSRLKVATWSIPPFAIVNT
jgi:uncharacterized protein (DUF1800 family)